MALYVIWRSDNKGPRKWGQFTDADTAHTNCERWQAREDRNQYRPYGPVTFTVTTEPENG